MNRLEEFFEPPRGSIPTTKSEYKKILIRLLEEYNLKQIAERSGRSILWLREILNESA